MRAARGAVCVALAAAVLGVACVAEPDPTPTAPPSTPTPTQAPTQSPSPDPTATDAPTPTETPEPELTLPLPDEADERQVEIAVAVEIPPDDGGRIVVTITSRADSMIEELVLRWPEELHETLFPAPFEPSPDRIRDGGPPLVQPWTKWVVGPGEHGEPEGTISLGYGPLLAGAVLEIPLYVTRNAEGPVAFDLHVLAGEAILALEAGEPAALRVQVP